MIAACGQIEARSMADAAGVWPAAEQICAQAAERRVDLLVLPEVLYPSYWLESVERYRQSDIEGTGAVLQRFSQLARAHRLWLVAGYIEDGKTCLYNAAAVFDREGRLVGSTRKQFLWDCDSEWFAPGRESKVFETEFGPMGVLICADLRLPEISATLRNRGAAFVVQPTAWVNISRTPDEYFNIQPEFLVRARAMEFGIPFVCASKSGREISGMSYVGQSMIVSPEGRVLAQAAAEGDALVLAEVELLARHAARPGDARLLERLSSREEPGEPDRTARRCKLPILVGRTSMEAALDRSAARWRRLASHDLESYVPARCAALEGVQVLLVAEGLRDIALARARAAENRVFVIVVDSGDGSLVINPGGMVMRADRGIVELDLAQADVKAFNPRTPIWSQRRVDDYVLA